MVQELRRGDLVRDIATKKEYIVLSVKKDDDKPQTAGKKFINLLVGDDEKPNVKCKRISDGIIGDKYDAELQLIKRTPR